MKERYRLDMITQDAEPQAVARPIGYFDTLDDVRDQINAYPKSRDYGFAVYDCETGSYLE